MGFEMGVKKESREPPSLNRRKYLMRNKQSLSLVIYLFYSYRNRGNVYGFLYSLSLSPSCHLSDLMIDYYYDQGLYHKG